MELLSLRSFLDGLDGNEKFQMYRKLWNKASHYQVLTDFPIHLDIELSGVCNLRCQYCFQTLISQPLGFMKVGLFRKIIDEGKQKGLCAIKLQIRGESFLHPKLVDCIRYAKQAGIMDVQITTNATLLDKKRIDDVLDSGLDGIIFSVDPHHSEDYRKHSFTLSYSDVERNIQNFLRARADRRQSRPWVRIQASIVQIDAQSVQDTELYIKEKFSEADIFVVNRIRRSENNLDSYPDLHTNYELLPCSYLMQRLSILWNGEVTTCCMDYNNHFQLGNVERQSIQEIWLSTKMDQFREMHLNGKRKMMTICKHCHGSSKRISDVK